MVSTGLYPSGMLGGTKLRARIIPSMLLDSVSSQEVLTVEPMPGGMLSGSMDPCNHTVHPSVHRSGASKHHSRFSLIFGNGRRILCRV